MERAKRAKSNHSSLATALSSIPKFSPVGNYIAYVRGHDVYITGGAAGELAVTTGGTEKKSHGLAEFVAQEEMGRFTGYWWSPDAKSIAFEEADAEGVEVWHVADPIHPDQPAQPFFYPRPGKANVKVRLGIVSVSPSSPSRRPADRRCGSSGTTRRIRTSPT